MGNKLPINALLQMSSSWDEVSECEQFQLIQEGLFVEETLEQVPLWAQYSQEEKQQIFLEAWASYTRAFNLKWVYVN